MPATYIAFNNSGVNGATRQMAVDLRRHFQGVLQAPISVEQLGTQRDEQTGAAYIVVNDDRLTPHIDDIRTIIDLRQQELGQQAGHAVSSTTAHTTSAVTHQPAPNAGDVRNMPVSQELDRLLKTKSAFSPPPATPAARQHPQQPVHQRAVPVSSHAVSSTSTNPQPMHLTFDTRGFSGATTAFVKTLYEKWPKLEQGAIVATGPGQVQVAADKVGFYGVQVQREMRHWQQGLIQREQQALQQLGDYGDSYNSAKQRIDAAVGIDKNAQKPLHQEIKDEIKALYNGKPEFVRFVDQVRVMDKFDADHGRGNNHGDHVQRLLNERNGQQQTGPGQAR